MVAVLMSSSLSETPSIKDSNMSRIEELLNKDELTREEREELKRYFMFGGTVTVETADGNDVTHWDEAQRTK